MKWTEERMQQHLMSFRSTPRYVLQNLYVFGWESDILFLSKSGFWTEIEIKVSRADFKADMKNKEEKHRILADNTCHQKPNQFFYAVPEGLVQPDEVPDYAGLLNVDDTFFGARTLKPAPWLHRYRITPAELDLADKFYYNMVNAKREALMAKRTAAELTEAYSQGMDAGRKNVMQAAMSMFSHHCPYREQLEDGRIRCHELGMPRFGICIQGLCCYLEEKEEELLRFLGRV